MATRRKHSRRQPTGVEQLIELPWQVSAVIGIAAFLFFLFVLPAAAGPVVGPVLRMFGWFGLIGFGVTAIVSFLRNPGPRTDFDSSRSAMSPKAPSPTTPLANLLDDEWEREIRARGMIHRGAEEEKPVKWSLSVLRSMEWKRFEYLAAAYYERIGFGTGPIGWGPDGGVDVVLFRGESEEAISIVQCKAWHGSAVPVEEVRALLGVMADRKVKTGVFLTTSTFTGAAASFADGNRIALIDGPSFLKRILALPSATQSELLAVACEGAWTTPSCATCGLKMIKREGKRGQFWGCPSFPRCRNKFQIRTT